MRLDNINVDILQEAANKADVEIDVAAKTVAGFYKGLAHILSNEKTVIKIDYFGKFIYSDAWKEKKEKIRMQFKDLKL